MRCAVSAVASPLGMLSMTCWFMACRSAILVDASSSLAPAIRMPSASEPLSNATAKKPKRFSATRYCAADADGSASTWVASHGWSM